MDLVKMEDEANYVAFFKTAEEERIFLFLG